MGLGSRVKDQYTGNSKEKDTKGVVDKLSGNTGLGRPNKLGINSNLTIRINEELKENFKVYCILKEVQMTDLLTSYIEDLVREDEEKIDKYKEMLGRK